jgi:protein-disulfide isomerase-like protein with CxxC motif
MSEAARIDFYADPLCPWCWRTALWIRDVAGRQPLTVNWKLFSLMVVNHPEDYADEQYAKWFALGRVLVAARRQGGNAAVESLYMSLGETIHGEQRRDELGSEAGVSACLTRAGLPESLYRDALADDSTASELIAEHREAKDRLAAFGVPTIALEGSDIGIFGPVIEPLPTGGDADILWEHVRWMLEQPYLWEVKRERTVKLGPQHVLD